jgi:hypothetical protein
MKKLAERMDIEDALKRLDQLTQEEVQHHSLDVATSWL